MTLNCKINMNYNTNMLSYLYRYSHDNDDMVVRLSGLAFIVKLPVLVIQQLYIESPLSARLVERMAMLGKITFNM